MYYKTEKECGIFVCSGSVRIQFVSYLCIRHFIEINIPYFLSCSYTVDIVGSIFTSHISHPHVQELILT